MKKGTKILLAGMGIAITGLVAYALLKKQDNKVPEVPAEDDNGEKEQVHGAYTSTQEFIERRKKRAAEMQAARKATQQQSVAITTDENTVMEETDMQPTTVVSAETAAGETVETPYVVEDSAESE